VLEHPRKVLGEPIAEIARLAEVSQPTVIRFCRSLGFLGLADFKLKFASSLTGTIPVRHSQVRVSDRRRLLISHHDIQAFDKHHRAARDAERFRLCCRSAPPSRADVARE
jgi:DNA-binding MurR/RpiR family transcriptional regulator